MKRLALCLAIWLAACAPSLPRPYLEARAAAVRAYAAGRYDEAASHWLEAEKAADRNRDRIEARYRAAQSLRRAGRSKQAAELLARITHESPASERASRSAYDRADIEIEQGDPARGYAMLEALARKNPRAPVAPHALRRYLGWLEEKDGASGALAYIQQQEGTLGKSELGETLAYERARILERAQRDDEALAAYLKVAERYPYPHGAHWDDALWNASLLEERLGRPERAVRHLRDLLSEMEPSHIQGSYQRPRYDDAQYRIAELYRDRLADKTRARREFRRVYSEHPTSILRDDALWNEALLASEQGDQRSACSALALLVDELPDSRYAACTKMVCPSVAPLRDGKCRSYISRTLRDEN